MHYYRRPKLRLRFVKFLDAFLMICSYIFIWFLTYSEPVRAEVSIQAKILLLVTTLALYILLGRIYEAFLLGVERIRDMVYSQLLTAFIVDVFDFLLFWITTGHVPTMPHYLLLLPTQAVVAVCWSYCANKWYFRSFPMQRILIVATDCKTARQALEESGFPKKFNIVDAVTTDQILSESDSILDDIDAVFLLNTQNAWAVMQLCAFKGITVYRTPLISEVISSRAKPVTLFHTPMLRMDGYDPPISYDILKRCMDFVLSGAALLVLLPLMILVSAAIWLEDRGPVFYRQERLTQGGRHFFILKFRSMHVNAESDGVVRLSSGKNDPRITKVGHIIRKLRIDELPQLINILKGDMSIVGPRPERPELAEEYSKVFPEFSLRLLSKAGLTGYAQVYGKYNTTPEDKLRMDLVYILRPSILEDIRIIFATVKILFVPESTEGVAEGQTTAMKQSKPTDNERRAESRS